MALAVVLVAVVVVTVRGLRRPPKHRAPVDTDDIALATPTERADDRTPVPRARDGEPTGIAHLHGRVLFPAGVKPSEELDVVAEDLTRRVTARITDGGQFDIHLPSGRYTLVASAGPLVGVVPDVLVRSGAARDVDIRLATGAAIRGQVRLPDGIECDVGLTAVPTGRDDEAGEPGVEDGRFAIDGLIAGRQYDLTFRGPGLRNLKLAGVSAPADGLNVELQARAEVSGAIGFPRGEECPISSVALQVAGKTIVDEGGEETSDDVGDDCTFSLAVPDQIAAVTVVATGDGWHLEEQVAIPPGGDPPPICLNPPCRSDPAEGRARLQLTLEGDPAPRELIATATVLGLPSNRRRGYGCSSGEGSCQLEGLPPGTTLLIDARGLDCRAPPHIITLTPGDNHARIACKRLRQIEGVVRIPAGEWLGRVSVRCPGSEDSRPVSGTRLFALTCSADATAVEYQIGSAGAWRRFPVAAAASTDDPAFVDIAPL